MIAALPESTLILDGEVAIFDEHLISRFEWLRHGARESLSTPPIYMVFDVLQVGSQDLRQEPLGHGGRCWRISYSVNAFSSPLGDSQGVA
jgi:ATP-dependent DNA ligase